MGAGHIPGGDNILCKIGDIEDNLPFIISNSIDQIFPENKKPFEIESNENDIILKDDNFDGFEIGLYIDNDLYKLAVTGDEIEIGAYQNERIKIIKRDVSKYVINQATIWR